MQIADVGGILWWEFNILELVTRYEIFGFCNHFFGTGRWVLDFVNDELGGFGFVVVRR